MKKIAILLVLIFSAYSVYSQKENVKVPQVVKSAFASRYPQVKKVEWSLERPGEYEGEFVINKIEQSIIFNDKGIVLETETDISETSLPQAVKKAWLKDSKGYKIHEIEKISDAKKNITYEIEAKQSNTKYKFIYHTDGKLLVKKIVDDEED